MVAEFNILYPLIVLAAAGCLFFAVREVRGLPMLSMSLLAPPLLAALITLGIALLAPLDAWLKTILGVALIVGVVGGIVRGWTMSMQVDHMWDLVRLLRSRDTQSVSALLALAVTCEIAFAFAGTAPSAYHTLPLAGAALSAGFLAGRAMVVAVRIGKSPHKELHWRLVRRED